jgi:tetratricopeptide (TPR) repeat protein
VTEQDTAQGLRYLNEALALDPTHALAWTEIARAHANGGGYGWETTFEGYRKAREAALRAIELAPDLAEGYLRLSSVQRLYDWDWTGAEASTRRALELAPGNPEAMRSSGGLLHILGQFEEAERLYRTALEQDPLSSAAYRAISLVYRSLDRHQEAEQAIRKGLELSPFHVGARMVLAIVLAERGRNEEALTEAKAETAEWARLTALAMVYFRLGRREEADQALAELEAKHAVDAPYQISAVHAERGDVDTAFRWLERATTEKDAGVAQANAERVFRPMHGDPRWSALMKKLGFEPSQARG